MPSLFIDITIASLVVFWLYVSIVKSSCDLITPVGFNPVNPRSIHAVTNMTHWLHQEELLAKSFPCSSKRSTLYLCMSEPSSGRVIVIISGLHYQ